VNYIGNKGTHLLTRTEIAQAVAPSNPHFCRATDAQGNLINLKNGDCPVAKRRPFPNFNIFINSEWEGHSNYHAGNVQLERRTSSLALQAVYTWAKSLDNKSAAAGIGSAIAGWNGFMDNHNPKLDYGRSDFDVNHRFVSNFVYQLPVGRGKQYLGSVNKAADALLGGWQVTGVVTFQKGFPYSVGAQDPLGLLDTIFGVGNRANVVGNPNSGFQRSLNQWFNTAAFAQPGVARYGNSARNFLRGPGLNNWDLGLGKTFSFNERVHMQFRVETFNTFNHPQYSTPDSNCSINLGPGQGSVCAPFDPSNPTVKSTYGKVSSTRVDAREIQLGLKLVF